MRIGLSPVTEECLGINKTKDHQIMSIWTKNILRFKLVRVSIAIGVITLLIFYLIDYNSVENKCRRQINKSSSYLPIRSSNKLQELQLDTVKNQLEEECINNNGVR
ncbi:MAG TPA: hypothetical protein VMW41_02250 [Candidatus Bathyarchaeia archaeon]|nr:hypothetical protein [Candidatus Bathyarchaeia archaeon]